MLHLACCKDTAEDEGTVEYMADCARQGGAETRLIYIEDIGINTKGQFTDLQDTPIENYVQAIPLGMDDERGVWRAGYPVPMSGSLNQGGRQSCPIKGLLPLLWEMFEGHPNLLPAYFDGDPAATALEGKLCSETSIFPRGCQHRIL